MSYVIVILLTYCQVQHCTKNKNIKKTHTQVHCDDLRISQSSPVYPGIQSHTMSSAASVILQLPCTQVLLVTHRSSTNIYVLISKYLLLDIVLHRKFYSSESYLKIIGYE